MTGSSLAPSQDLSLGWAFVSHYGLSDVTDLSIVGVRFRVTPLTDCCRPAGHRMYRVHLHSGYCLEVPVMVYCTAWRWQYRWTGTADSDEAFIEGVKVSAAPRPCVLAVAPSSTDK